jgi:hypothetical protein
MENVDEGGCLSIDGGQENARVSAAEEGELSSEASTHPNADYSMYSTFLTGRNVVVGGIRAKPELHDGKHVFSRKCRDLTDARQNPGRAGPPERQRRIGELDDLIIKLAQVQRRLSRGHRWREVWS